MKRERSASLGGALISLVLLAGTASGQEPAFKLAGPGGPAPALEMEAGPVVVCFVEGTNLNYARRVEALVAALNQARYGQVDYQLASRWSGSQGAPRALTWSFAPDGLSIGSGVGEPVAPNNLFSSMDSKFASQGGRATWVAQFVNSFARWQALSGLTYTRITVGGNDWDDGAAWGASGSAGLRGDIRIAAKNIDAANGILAYNGFPSSGGDMVLDSSESWQSGSPTYRFLRNTIMHEHGHGIGLQHSCPIQNTKLMEPFLSTSFDGPQQDDIRGAQRHYGDPYEANDSAGTADFMGALTIPGSLTFGNIPSPTVNNAALLSIDADGESDFWTFSVPASCIVSATATPIGTNYAGYVQDANCNNTTANTNAVAMANLGIEIRDTNGVNVLGSSTSAGTGLPETVSNVGLPSAGTYYVRVFETDTPSQSQLYRVTISVTGNPICPTASQQPSPQTSCEGLPVSFTFVASGNPTPTYQWRRNLVNIPGATSSTYSVAAVTDGQEGSYDCVATNSCGSVTSNAVTLTVYTAPAFTQQPSNQSAPVGGSASFTVAVSGDPTPALQWRKDGSPIPGANSTTLTISPVTLGDAGSYTCDATNVCDVINSSAATLTVTTQSCYANCDGSSGSPILTANDFQCFIDKFAANDPYANCDGSSGVPVLTANDFQCFINGFAAGCP